MTRNHGFRTSSVAIVALMAWVLDAATSVAWAQDIEPRAFSNAPVGVNFLVVGYAYTRGGLAFDSALPVTNPDLTTSNAVVAYARVFDFWGKSGKFDAIVPYTWLSGTADLLGQPIQRTVDGFGNSLFRVSVNLYGAPALSLKEFASYQQDVIVGVSLQVGAPWSQYDDSRVVNIGTNRWSFKPEVGVSKAMGPWTLELTAAATFFTDNDDFYGGNKRSQDPLYSTQVHAIYNFDSGIWASLDGTYFVGGRTSHQRRAEQRPPVELAHRRHAGVPGRPLELGQAVREQRRVRADGQQLRPDRDRVAVPLGWRSLSRTCP